MGCFVTPRKEEVFWADDRTQFRKGSAGRILHAIPVPDIRGLSA
jgi:hypothetical protein